MKVEDIIRGENGDIHFTLKAEPEEWKWYLNYAAGALQKRQPVQGYRVGKAPLGVCMRVFGKELMDRATTFASNDLLDKACAEHGFMPVSDAERTITAADADRFEMEVSFDLYPEITEMDYKGLVIDRPVKHCSEQDIDNEVDRYMKSHLYVHEVPREARMEDIAEVSFTGTHQGRGFPYDHSDKVRFVMGSGILFTGLDEALVGHVAGDDLELSLTMPKDFHREPVAGLTLDLKVHLIGVWARDLLECTDEYVKEHIKDADTVAEFREQLRATIQGRYDNRTKTIFNENFEKVLVDRVTVPIPNSMVETVIGRFVSTLREIAQQEGKTAEQVLEEEGKTLEEYRESVRPIALRQVKVSVALDYVVHAEKLTVTRERVNAVIANHAQIQNVSPEEAKRRLGGDESIVEQLLNTKARELVLQYAEPNEFEVEDLG